MGVNSVADPGCFIPGIRKKLIPDPGGKKAGSGSATLGVNQRCVSDSEFERIQKFGQNPNKSSDTDTNNAFK
jgi:hypothetical protein